MRRAPLPYSAVALVVSACLTLVPATASARPDEAPDGEAETLTVHGVREHRVSRGAANLPLSWEETPQSVSEIEREWLEAFAIDNVNDALKLVTGVNVESVETDRTYYNARGFDIKSMQVDGIGLPFNWNVVGALDTAVYERIEIVRGANGLLTGTGNPSGTINFVRKRPTSDFAASAELTAGSWDKQRVEADLSTPLTESGSWAARVVAVAQDGDSWLDHYHNERSVLYGILDGQLTDNAVLTIGHTRQENESTGVLWGALPLQYSDGSQTDYDVSTSTTMNWTNWRTENDVSFVELSLALGDSWTFDAVYTINDYYEPSELFYVYGNPDPATGLGLFGWPGNYESVIDRELLDLMLHGEFTAFGREHQLIVGVSLADTDNGYLASPAPADDPAWGALPAFPGWRGDEIARPAFGDTYVASDWNDEITRAYVVGQFNLSDGLNLIAGGNYIDFATEGYSFGEPMNRDTNELSPYIGATWQFTPDWYAYASYSDIYEPQTQLDVSMQPLGAAVGESYEAGVKTTLIQDQLTGSLALFRAEQDNYAEYAGFDVGTGMSYYEGISLLSEGYELEFLGKLSDGWLVIAGYTDLELEGEDGSDVRTYVPRQTLNLSTRYRPQSLSALEVGVSVRWQDDIEITNWLGRIAQPAYTLVSAFARYDVTENVTLSANLDNATDEKYLTSLYWDQAFYGAPRSGSVSVALKF